MKNEKASRLDELLLTRNLRIPRNFLGKFHYTTAPPSELRFRLIDSNGADIGEFRFEKFGKDLAEAHSPWGCIRIISGAIIIIQTDGENSVEVRHRFMSKRRIFTYSSDRHFLFRTSLLTGNMYCSTGVGDISVTYEGVFSPNRPDEKIPNPEWRREWERLRQPPGKYWRVPEDYGYTNTTSESRFYSQWRIRIPLELPHREQVLSSLVAYACRRIILDESTGDTIPA